MSEKRKTTQYLNGMRSAVPVILGFVPVGIAYAIMARQAGFSVLQTCGMSLTVFAGASQMMAVGMYVQGASVIAMILATFILNLRHLIMSTCVVNQMRGDSTIIKLLAAFGVTDESFAIFTSREKKKNALHGFFWTYHGYLYIMECGNADWCSSLRFFASNYYSKPGYCAICNVYRAPYAKPYPQLEARCFGGADCCL